MTCVGDTGSDGFTLWPLPFEVRVGQLMIQIETKFHDDIAWTPVEPAARCDAAPGLAEMVRFKFEVTGDAPKPPGTSAGEGGEPPTPEPNPPIPPPKETPS